MNITGGYQCGSAPVQTHGITMATKMAVAFSVIFMAHVEKQLLHTSPYSHFPGWKKFIDDIFSVWTLPENEINNFIDFANSFYLTNRFHVAVRLFSSRSQMTSKCGKNNEVAHQPQASVSLMFLPHFGVLCGLSLNGPKVTWNLFVLYNDHKRKKTDTHTCLVPPDCSKICASLGIFKSQALLFVSASSFFLYLNCI